MNPRLSIWYGCDPFDEKYPHISTYCYTAGNPVVLTDIEGKDIVIAGKGKSSVTFKTDLIDISVNASSLGINWGGNYTIQGREVLNAALDIVGIVDPTGVADALNASIYASNYEWLNASISAVGLIPYLGDAAKLYKVGKDYKIISHAISQVQRNRTIGKIAERQVTESLKKIYGKEAKIGEQISARFKDGSKVVFDNVVVKDGKVVLIGETKSGKAVLSKQQKRFFNEGQEVTFVGDRSAELGIKGRKISNKTVETKVTTIPVTKL